VTPGETAAWGFVAAIATHLSPPWDARDQFGDGAYATAAGDVKLAWATITGTGFDPAAVAEITALLGGEPPLPPGHGPNHVDNAGRVVSACVPGECITCHGHVDAGGVFHPAKAAS
jgi:hypothetical protein